jgi:two-component system cell cycle sensor histidine kinase/response regulator CckA
MLLNPKTILLVEDEDAVSYMINLVLKRGGYHVLLAKTGTEAMNLVADQKNKVDLLLTDIVLPGGMSGVELAKKLAALQPGLKVLFSTGYDVETVARDVPLMEGVNFLQKPYEPSHLLEMVEKTLGG